MIIDFHAHVGSMDSIGARYNIDEILRAMDAARIDITCLFNICHGNAHRANILTATAVRAHSDRLIGFSFVTPHYPEEMDRELTFAHNELGLRGIKIYPPYAADTVEHEQWDVVFKFAHQHGLPLISHTDGHHPIVSPNRAEPQMFVPWARRYPNASIVLGHAGNFSSGRRSSVMAANACPNIYIETCTSWRERGAIEELVEGAGADRILFGSDMPILDPRIQVGRVATADISSAAKNLALGGNAARILGLQYTVQKEMEISLGTR